MLSVAGIDSLIWIKSRGRRRIPIRRDARSSRPREGGVPSWPAPQVIAPGLLCELELQCADVERVAHLGIVECGEAKLVRAVQIVELDVVLAAGHKLAGQHDAPLAVVPGDVGR